MIDSVRIVQSNNLFDLENEINEIIGLRNAKDIKFCVNEEIHSSMGGGAYSSGAKYYAMIIFDKI